MRFIASLGRKSAASTSNGSPATMEQHAVNTLVGNALEYSDNIVFLLQNRDDILWIVAANKEAQQVTGYSCEQLVGQPLTVLIDKAKPAAMEPIYAAVREGRAQRAKLQCISRTGQSFWFGLHILPAGKPSTSCFVVLGHDITDKLHQEAQEKAVQSLLAKVFVTVDAAVYIADVRGYIVMTNPAFDRLIGNSAGTLVGRQSADLYAPACRHAVIAAREKQNVDALDYSIDVKLLLHNDQEVPGRVTVAMVQRADLSRFRIVTMRKNDSAAPGPIIRKVNAAGRIQLIGLDEVRESLGPRWPSLKERAVATADSVLRRRLGPHDTFSHTEDIGFIICFANASEEEAGFRAAAIGSEIRQRLIGHGDSPETAHVFATAVAVPPGKKDLPAAEFSEMVRQRLGQRLSLIQETARTNLKQALEDVPYEAEPVYSRDMTPAGWRVKLTLVMQRALEVAIGALPAAETAIFDQDNMLLGFAHECLVERALQSPSSLVFVTLSSDVLFIRKRMDTCLEACQAIAETHRKQLVLTVTASEEATSRQINNRLPRLRSFCRYLGVAVEGADGKALDMREAGINFMLVDANTLNGTAKTKALVGILRSQQCKLMVHGATSRDVASLLRDGASFVSLSRQGTNE